MDKVHSDYYLLMDLGDRLAKLAEMQINRPIRAVWNSIRELNYPINCNWSGIRYNELVKYLNTIRNDMHERFTGVFSVDIPLEIYRISKNYATFDEQTQSKYDREYESSHQHEYVCTFDEIEPYYIEGQIDFIQDKVEEVRCKVEKNFNYIESAFESYKNLYNTRDWEGNAEKSFMAEIINATSYASETFKEISLRISTCMQQTIEDMQKTEDANTINGPIPPGQFPKIKLDLDN